MQQKGYLNETSSQTYFFLGFARRICIARHVFFVFRLIKFEGVTTCTFFYLQNKKKTVFLKFIVGELQSTTPPCVLQFVTNRRLELTKKKKNRKKIAKSNWLMCNKKIMKKKKIFSNRIRQPVQKRLSTHKRLTILRKQSLPKHIYPSKHSFVIFSVTDEGKQALKQYCPWRFFLDHSSSPID